MAKIYRFLLLFRKHGSHHVAGILSMICDSADDFSQPDQMKYGNSIGLHVKDLFLDSIFIAVGFVFLLAKFVDDILDNDALFLGKLFKIQSCFNYQLFNRTLDAIVHAIN